MTSKDEIARSAPQKIDEVRVEGMKLACLADIHGNTVALDAVLATREFAEVDAVVVLGCATGGPDPRGVLDRLNRLSLPVFRLAGNGERWILGVADGTVSTEREVDDWYVRAHGADGLAELRTWPSGLRASWPALGGLRFCHGSPRSDIEILTRRTTDERVRAATEGVSEHTILHGHTHVQYGRVAAGKRVIGVGSVGLPYGPRRGARWAKVTSGIRLLATPFDIDAVQELVTRMRFPNSNFVRQLRDPPTARSMDIQGEQLQFSN